MLRAENKKTKHANAKVSGVGWERMSRVGELLRTP